MERRVRVTRTGGGGPTASGVSAAARALADDPEVRAVVLVEGRSDQAAVHALARRDGRDLAGEGVHVVAMGGATNIGHFLDVLGPGGADIDLFGLYDEGEEPQIRRGLERAGMGEDLTRSDLAAHGFHVCVADLEDELIRALGTDAVEALIQAQGESRSLRTLRSQPAWRGRDQAAALHRFMGVRSGRKIRYGSLLVDALPPDRIPDPLRRLLDDL